MVRHSIPELHNTLEELNGFFRQKSVTFCQKVGQHQGQFTPQDYSQFTSVVEDIKQYAMNSINNFFKRKISQKCEPYELAIITFEEEGSSACNSLREFRQELEEATLELKRVQKKREDRLDFLSLRYSNNFVLKKAWKLLKNNKEEEQRKRAQDNKIVNVYRRNLLKKAFFPWRRLTYREGYASTVKRQTSYDVMQIHSQYQSIIDILKGKINDTEDMIKLKKAAKGQFAYALSKNLLKSISNLSMEVMSLNQMSLKDGDADERETKKFMKEVDTVIQQKLTKVREFKNTVCQIEDPRNRKKKITFA